MPLHSAGKLGAVLFQFPQWFVIGRKNKDYILECAERLKDFRLAIEFRHKTWLEERNAEETLSFLEEHDLPLVCVDMPQGFDSSVPPIAAATAKDLALVRFHGRDPGGLGQEERERLRALPLRVLGAGAQGVGPEDPGRLRTGSRDPRADEQLLPGLRRQQRAAARGPAGGMRLVRN
jgi:Uncharacterized conserved protein